MQSHPKFLQISHNNLQDLNPSFLGNLMYFHGLFFRSLISGYYQNLCSISMNLERSFLFWSISIQIGFNVDEFRGIFGICLFRSISGAGFFPDGAGFFLPGDIRYPIPGDTRYPTPGAGKKKPGAGKKKPGAGKKKPGAGKKKTGAGKKKPGAGKKNPAPGKKKPAPESKIERFLETHRN